VGSDMLKLDSLHVSCAGGGGADLRAHPSRFPSESGLSFNKRGRISATFSAMPLTFVQPFVPDPITIGKGAISDGFPLKAPTMVFRRGQGQFHLQMGNGYIFECDKPLGPMFVDIDFRNDSILLRSLQSKWGGGHVTEHRLGRSLEKRAYHRPRVTSKLNDVRVGGAMRI